MAFYSLIQYEADPDREEGVNVGVVLVDSEASTVCVRVLETSELFQHNGWLKRDLQALATRLGRLESYDAQALQHFAGCEAGYLVLRPPRAVLCKSPVEQTQELFEQLVLS